MVLGIDDAGDLWGALALLEPQEEQRLAEWSAGNVINETGRPYDHSRYPHLAAPGGPFDAADYQAVRIITLQWGVRLGKTFGGQCFLLHRADQRPGPAMMATSQQKLAKEGTEKLLDLIRQSRLSRLLGKPERLQRRDKLTLVASRLYVAWSRSASTLADKNIRYGHAWEVDKWEHATTSTEGDPLELFFDRFNDYEPVKLIWVESTPSVRGKSRVERLRLEGWNCQYHVPCPWCQEYQVLEWGEEGGRYGFRWERGPDGRSDAQTARRTAVYVCRWCERAIDSGPRQWMMGHGVWVPEGCEVVRDEALRVSQEFVRPRFAGWGQATWIKGTPLRSGDNASYQLASWYSLAIPDWGFFPARFVRVAHRRAGLQVFVNQNKAETFEVTERKSTWEEVGQRLIQPAWPRGLVPDGTLLLTMGIDKQETVYKWSVNAWRAGESPHTVAYGQSTALAELEELLTMSWRCEAGGAMSVYGSCIDSGFRPAEVYRWTQMLRSKGVRIRACRGASVPLNTFVKVDVLSRRATHAGQKVAWVDANSTQDWLDRQLYEIEPGRPGSRSLYGASLADHQAYLEELINDGPVAGSDSNNNPTERWKRLDETIPNDWRDAERYAFVAWLMVPRRRRAALWRAVGSGQSAVGQDAWRGTSDESDGEVVQETAQDVGRRTRGLPVVRFDFG